MKKNGKRIVLSVGAVLTALCITAGATMAYFNDTEPVSYTHLPEPNGG